MPQFMVTFVVGARKGLISRERWKQVKERPTAAVEGCRRTRLA
jgi:hypothetical protein